MRTFRIQKTWKKRTLQRETVNQRNQRISILYQSWVLKVLLMWMSEFRLLVLWEMFTVLVPVTEWDSILNTNCVPQKLTSSEIMKKQNNTFVLQMFCVCVCPFGWRNGLEKKFIKSRGKKYIFILHLRQPALHLASWWEQNINSLQEHSPWQRKLLSPAHRAENCVSIRLLPTNVENISKL